MKKILALLVLSLVSMLTFAQSAEEGPVLDLRASGKIYVVVAVIAIIFIGLAFYLFSIDRRIKKIEKEG
jgi:CcmD family protein